VDEEGAAGRKGWWMNKEQQEGKMCELERNSWKRRLVDKEGKKGREGW
jgi:hypothetical protein